MKPEINMRVRVYSPDKTEDLGLGTITAIGEFMDAGTGEVYTHNMPEITLGDGRQILGLDCWWRPVEEDEDAN